MRRRNETLTRLSLKQAANRSSVNRIAASGLVPDQMPSLGSGVAMRRFHLYLWRDIWSNGVRGAEALSR